MVINCVHFSPTDHIIAFSGMVSGQGKISVPQFTAPVYVYNSKVNASRRRSQTLPSLPTSKDEVTKSTGEKFKSMLSQLDRMILDKQDEMESALST